MKTPMNSEATSVDGDEDAEVVDSVEEVVVSVDVVFVIFIVALQVSAHKLNSATRILTIVRVP